jgi:hypothetical protein
VYLPTHQENKTHSKSNGQTGQEEEKPTLSAHINPWTISSGILRTQSLQATRAAAAASKIPP